MKRALLLMLMGLGCGRVPEVPCFNSTITCEADCVSACYADADGLWVSRWDATCSPMCWDSSRPRDGGR